MTMYAPFRQQPLAEMPRLDFMPIATMKLDPQQLTERFGISFEDDFDDLYYLKGALVLPSKDNFLYLLKYINIETVSTDILIPRHAIAPQIQLDDFLHALGLNQTDLSWRAENFPPF